MILVSSIFFYLNILALRDLKIEEVTASRTRWLINDRD